MKRILFSTLTTAALGLNSFAAITFNFTYQDDGTGAGFDDASEGVARKATVQAVADYINTVFVSDGEVDITWETSLNDGSSGNPLGSMGQTFGTTSSDFSNAVANNTGLIANGFVTGNILGDTNANGAAEDGSGVINFGYSWNSDHTMSTASGEFDLFTVVLHEMTHSLGFLSALNSDGSGLAFSDGTNTVQAYTSYDLLLRNAAGNQIVNSAGVFVGAVADLTSETMQLDTGSELIQIYSPTTFSGGSSLSHTDFGDHPNLVTNHSIASGVERRTLNSQEIAIFEAIGFTPVPEPSSLLYTICGVGSLVLNRRRKK